MSRPFMGIFLAVALVSCAQSDGKPPDPIAQIKTHITGATKIEIIHDLSGVPDAKWDKKNLIWAVPDTHKMVIVDKRLIGDIKSLISFTPSTARLGEGGMLLYFYLDDRPVYTSLINGMFVVHTESPDRPGFLDKKYKFKASPELIEKISSMKTKKRNS